MPPGTAENTTANCQSEIDKLEQEKRYIALTGFQLLIVTVGAIILLEIWTRLRPGHDSFKRTDEDSESDHLVNIVQLRIRHEIEKQVCSVQSTS